MTSYKDFQAIQKKIFFSKTDIPLLYGKKIKEIPKKEALSSINIICYSVFHSPPSTIQKLDRSTLHDVYKVIIQNKSYVIRFSRLNDLYSDNFLKIEKSIVDYLHRSIIPAPQILLTDLSRKKVPYDYHVSNYIEGESLYTISPKSDNYFYQFGQTIGKLHSISTKQFGPFILSSFKKKVLKAKYRTWQKYLLLNLEDHLEYCLKNKIINSITHQKLQELFKSNKYLSQNILPVLLHGDVANHNVLFHKGKITAFIDWEDAISGDPIYDISFYGTGVYKNKRWFNNFLKGYVDVTNIKIDSQFWLRYWFYFIRIAVFKAIIRHRSGETVIKGAPYISERLVYGLDHLK